jgi:hypothetical protein
MRENEEACDADHVEGVSWRPCFHRSTDSAGIPRFVRGQLNRIGGVIEKLDSARLGSGILRSSTCTTSLDRLHRREHPVRDTADSSGVGSECEPDLGFEPAIVGILGKDCVAGTGGLVRLTEQR